MAGDPPTGLVDRAYSVGEHATEVQAAAGNRTRLIRTLGIVQIVCGGITALLTVGLLLSAKQRLAISYGVAAINLLATGIGSVTIKRWARRTTIISAAIWLGFMSLGLAVLAFGSAAVGAVMIPIALVSLVLPVVLIAVYTRPSVRATFERNQAP